MPILELFLTEKEFPEILSIGEYWMSKIANSVTAIENCIIYSWWRNNLLQNWLENAKNYCIDREFEVIAVVSECCSVVCL